MRRRLGYILAGSAVMLAAWALLQLRHSRQLPAPEAAPQALDAAVPRDASTPPDLAAVQRRAGLVLVPGTYYYEDVRRYPHDGWLGLFQVGSRWELRRTRLVARRGKDPDSSGELPTVIGTSSNPEAALLLRNIDGLRVGAAAVVWQGDDRLQGGYHREIQLGEGIWHIDVVDDARAGSINEATLPARLPTTGGVAADAGLLDAASNILATVQGSAPEGPPPRPRVILSRNESRQSLFSTKVMTDQAGGPWVLEPALRLLLAGDLDGDGRLDLLLELTDECCNGSWNYTLLLSSRAAPGELVGVAAVFTSSAD